MAMPVACWSASPECAGSWARERPSYESIPDGAPAPEESGLFPVEAQSFEVPLVARGVAPFR